MIKNQLFSSQCHDVCTGIGYYTGILHLNKQNPPLTQQLSHIVETVTQLLKMSTSVYLLAKTT